MIYKAPKSQKESAITFDMIMEFVQFL